MFSGFSLVALSVALAHTLHSGVALSLYLQHVHRALLYIATSTVKGISLKKIFFVELSANECNIYSFVASFPLLPPSFFLFVFHTCILILCNVLHFTMYCCGFGEGFH